MLYNPVNEGPSRIDRTPPSLDIPALVLYAPGMGNLPRIGSSKDSGPPPFGIDAGNGRSDQEKLAALTDMVREMSLQEDPQQLVGVFRRAAAELYPGGDMVAISRRDVQPPYYRITRSTRWNEDINPWLQPDRLPLLSGGLLGHFLENARPERLRNICVPPDDPAYAYVGDARAAVALPIYERGEALNMVVRTSPDPAHFDDLRMADALLQANLFGRATSSLILSRKLQDAYTALDRELKQVGRIQRALLPPVLPRIPGLEMAVSYVTAARAGGDYYDFFNLGGDRWGLLIADVSGHGTPAAVVMSMIRTILHSSCMSDRTPADMLRHVNGQLMAHGMGDDGAFVTAFYGIYRSGDRGLTYASAGHNPPLVVDRRIRVRELDEAQALPLGVDADHEYVQHDTTLQHGDTMLLYTDGITEAMNDRREMYGRDRLLSCVREDVPNAQHIIDCVTNKLIGFTGDAQPADDQTLLAVRVEP